MSKTVVYDQHENQKQIMNAINVFARHCRIGKVTQKCQSYSDLRRLADFSPPMQRLTDIMFMPKCGCRVGYNCGSSACPHASLVNRTANMSVKPVSGPMYQITMMDGPPKRVKYVDPC